MDFEKEIKNLAKEKIKSSAGGMPSETEADGRREIKEVMKIFLDIAGSGVRIYNQGLADGRLSIYELTEELLTLFLNLHGKRLGFCLVAEGKFVVFLDEAPNQMVVLGQKRQLFGAGENVLTKARQLIKIAFEKADGGYVFKDNTGSRLDPEEVVLHIIKWAISL
ncbi:MAG: hypothetical protein ACRENT_01745 [Thermodesulfobacteriota bacterium]